VIGFSMGGSLGTLLAAREKVDRLVLASPYYGVTYEWYYLLPVETWQTLIGWAVPYVVKFDAFIQVNRPGVKDQILTYHTVPMRGVKTLIALGREARAPETLGAVHCPVLMLQSDGDMASSPRRSKAAFAGLASSGKRYLDLPARNNHHIFWDWEHETVKQAIVDFLNQPAAAEPAALRP
jgi:esterase/lipase